MNVKTEVTEKKKVGRPPSRKKLLTLRLEPEVVDFYREQGGKGWLQTVNDTLKEKMVESLTAKPKKRPRRVAAE